jgi:hypothetical protein
MKVFALAAIAFAASVAMAGCQSTKSTIISDITQFNAAVATDLPTACALEATTYASFLTAVATGTVPAKYVSVGKQANAAAQAICMNPSAVNASTALQTLANSYAAIVQARNGS